jgi:chlorobactene glucosyltransferase
VRTTARRDATARPPTTPRIVIEGFEDGLTHATALIALAYAVRAASFGPSWVVLPPLAGAPRERLPSLSIVVPARDEERSIERCVRSLLAQRYIDDLEVIVIDDRSTDRTRAILDTIAAEDPRLRIFTGEEMPEGWVGKPWALAQAERHAHGDWLLFTDADSHHGPLAAATTLWYATKFGADAISLATHQELGTFWERASVPTILGTLVFVSGPFGAINDPAQPVKAIANGQYILVSRAAYDALGGHAALAGEIVEDVAFARRLKEDGRFRYLLLGGHELASVRMYRSLPEIWSGFTKNIYFGAGGDLRALAGAVVFLLTTSAVPIALCARNAARRKPLLALEAFASLGTIVAAQAFGMRRAGFSPRLAPLQPLGTLLFAAITLNSTFAVLSGRGVAWRGRRYGREAGVYPPGMRPTTETGKPA